MTTNNDSNDSKNAALDDVAAKIKAIIDATPGLRRKMKRELRVAKEPHLLGPLKRGILPGMRFTARFFNEGSDLSNPKNVIEWNGEVVKSTRMNVHLGNFGAYETFQKFSKNAKNLIEDGKFGPGVTGPILEANAMKNRQLIEQRSGQP